MTVRDAVMVASGTVTLAANATVRRGDGMHDQQATEATATRSYLLQEAWVLDVCDSSLQRTLSERLRRQHRQRAAAAPRG